ncbi:hypothetical protein [Nocardia pseudovaccinii]|uniref:hypothetical protein n=1 Tax=Nocardia pseudovaccinii TaxID=189540 RepID=UPI0007A3C0BF|nr:hypothetical protein [Nocardia pseudovaccinii]
MNSTAFERAGTTLSGDTTVAGEIHVLPLSGVAYHVDGAGLASTHVERLPEDLYATVTGRDSGISRQVNLELDFNPTVKDWADSVL